MLIFEILYILTQLLAKKILTEKKIDYFKYISIPNYRQYDFRQEFPSCCNNQLRGSLCMQYTQ